MKDKFNVLIIGTGKIGAFFDNPNSKNILTHAHAFSCHRGFNLVGFVDSDKKQAAKAAKIWNVNAYDDINQAFKPNKIDVVCIAASTDMHHKILKESLKYPMELILLEKPIARTLDELKKIIELCSKAKKPMVVNYMRRFLPEFEKIKTAIKKGAYGNFVAGTGYYGKGLLNNGSHMIDLLHFFFGYISEFKIIDSCNDFSAGDPTITAVLTLSNKKSFILQGISSELFTLFEMDLIFEKQRIRIIDLGQKIEFHKIKNSAMFKGYKNIVKFSENTTAINKYMYFVADNIYNNLTKGKKIKCDIFDGYKASELCFKIIEKQS
ncbi:MAG: Gfo/Idh/MocA family oxidoreductase [Patescibacteria group bacterium]